MNGWVRIFFQIDFVTFESVRRGIMEKQVTMTITMTLYTRFKTANNDAVNVMIGRNPERRNLSCI